MAAKGFVTIIFVLLRAKPQRRWFAVIFHDPYMNLYSLKHHLQPTAFATA